MLLHSQRGRQVIIVLCLVGLMSRQYLVRADAVRCTRPASPQNAVKRVQMDPGTTDYRWLSAQEALFFRRQNDDEPLKRTLVRHNIITGKEKPLPELMARFGDGPGNFENAKVSGDGKWIIWDGPRAKGDFGSILSSTNGIAGKLPELLSKLSVDDIYWIGSSHRLLALDHSGGKKIRANIFDLDKPAAPRKVVIPPGFALPSNSFGESHITVTDTDDFVFSDWDAEAGEVTPAVRIVRLRLAATPGAPHTYRVLMPAQARLYQIALSPTGEKIVWELSFIHKSGKPTVELWLSGKDGSAMHSIERIPIQPDDPPDIILKSQHIHWTPDEKQVSFVYDYTLWTIPAK